jgi:hypothetical protein
MLGLEPDRYWPASGLAGVQGRADAGCMIVSATGKLATSLGPDLVRNIAPALLALSFVACAAGSAAA